MSLYIFTHFFLPHLIARYGQTQWTCHVPRGLQPVFMQYLQFLARLKLAAPVCTQHFVVQIHQIFIATTVSGGNAGYHAIP